MDTTSKKTRLWGLLIIGLSLWIAGIASYLFFPAAAFSLADNTFFLFLQDHSLPVTLIVAIIALPLVCETIFRGWAGAPQRRRECYLTLALSAILLALLWVRCIHAHGLLAAVIASVAFATMVLAIFIPKLNDRQKQAVLLATTTIIYVSLCLSYCDSAPVWCLTNALLFTGLSLITYFLVVNRNLLFAIAFHLLSNSVIILILLFAHSVKSPLTFSAEDNATVSISKMEDNPAGIIMSTSGDSLIIHGSLADIAASVGNLNPGDAKEFYKSASPNPPYYKLTVHPYSALSDSRDIVIQMKALGLLSSDTAYVPSLIIDIDTASPCIPMRQSSQATLSDLINQLHSLLDMPVFPAESLNPQYPVNLLSSDDLDAAKGNIDNLNRLLKENHGLAIYPAPYDKTALVILSQKKFLR